MQRRKALAIAASGAAALAAATAALAANLGLLAAPADAGGKLGARTAVQAPVTQPAPTAAEPLVTYVYEDIPVPSRGAPSAVTHAGVDPALEPTAPGARDDDWNDDDHEDEDSHQVGDRGDDDDD